ncbi:MAG: NAD(P)-dependent oxidoreductase [Planctomycetota bacterium]|jgi:lactate dehydrogenase-like 2-hydroxyacid dehydrogenase
MSDVVLTTPLQYSKGGNVFRLADVEVEEAPAEEGPLAEAVKNRSCRAVIVGSEPYQGPLYEALAATGGPGGAIIARFGVGHDNIDKGLARQHNIVVTTTPGALDVSVAEHTMWLLGSLVKNVASMAAAFKAGRFIPQTGAELSGKPLGILGFGTIGRRVAAVAHRGFGMKVFAADCLSAEEQERQLGKSFDEIKAEYGLEHYTTDSDSVLPRARLISVHLPSTDATRHFIDARRMHVMKPGTMLVNTSRGSLVDEAALYDALAEGWLAGAALDVFESEPYEPVSPDKDLRTLENVVLTPHAASNTSEANRRIAERALENVTRFFAGRLDELDRVDGD